MCRLIAQLIWFTLSTGIASVYMLILCLFVDLDIALYFADTNCLVKLQL